MAILNDILGKAIPTNLSNVSYTILDNIYSFNAIWLQDAQRLFNFPDLTLFGVNILNNIPLPLIGFAYQLEGEVELLSYEWAKYPYLSKQIITNAGIKQPTKFSVNVYSVLGPLNPVAFNIIKLSLVLSILDKYVANGGLFTVITMYGNLTDCVLEKISGISGQGPDGTQLKFYFSRPNISTITSVTKSTTDFISKLMGGGAV